MAKAKPRCRNCRHFFYGDAKDYPDGGDWGYCRAPVPQHVTIKGDCTVMATDKAKRCPTYSLSEASRA